MYLEPHHIIILNYKSEVYSLYKNDWCLNINTQALSLTTFCNPFNELKLALFSPRTDDCDVCVGFRIKNIEATMYIVHIAKKMKQ